MEKGGSPTLALPYGHRHGRQKKPGFSPCSSPDVVPIDIATPEQASSQVLLSPSRRRLRTEDAETPNNGGQMADLGSDAAHPVLQPYSH